MTTIHALYFRARSLALIYALFVALPLVRFARRLRASCHRPRPVRARFAHYGFRRFACLLMVAVMVVQFALFPPEVSQAAVKAVSAKAANYKQDTLFWWNSSGWAARSERFLRENFPNFGSTVQQRNWDGKGAPRLAAPKPQPQETQDARNGRVARVEISPREATIAAGERIHFIAVAYDADNSPVGGVSFDWDKEDEDTGEKMSAQDRGKFSSANGGFSSAKEGNFRVKARFGGFEASAKVKVKGVRHSFGQQPIGTRTVSSSDLPQQSRSSLSPTATKDRIAKNAPGRFRTKYSSAGTMAMPRLLSLLPNEYGWTDNNFWSADDPNKERGEPAGHAPDGGAGSGNFQFSAPVLSLSGRGQNVKLDLIYNSRVWHKANNEMTFNIDDDWPTPGGSISFGKIVGMGSQNGYMIIEPDGTRRPYTCSITFYPVHQEAVCKTTDGSFIDYKVIGDSPANGGAPTSVDVYLPNGTQVFYGNPGNNAVYATLFWDRNGNTVYVSYRNGHGPHINNITDTLGRVVQVYYDSNNLPVAITAPGLNGGTRTLVRITYQWKDLGNLGGNYGFSGLTTKVRSNVIPVIRAIYYPGNNTGYWFGGEDSYSAYGMLAKVIQQRGMVFSGAQLPGDPNQAADPGTITPGLMTRQIVYDYPLVASGLTKEPSYQTTTETWALMDVAPVVTQYFVQENASPRRVEITRPDGVKTVMLSHNATGQWYDGLIFQDESYSPQGALLGRSFVQWDLGDYSSPRPSRVETTDERGQRTGKELSYGPRFNQVSETREYGYGYVFGGANPLLRRTVNQYLNHPDYTDPLPQYPYIWHHIYNLVTLTDVYSGDGARLSRTEYFYDQFKGTDGLMNTPGINSTGYEIGMSPYVNQPNYTIYKLDTRGNVTTVKRYADAAALDESSTVVETMHYDITGNVRKAETSCCTQTTFNYTLSTQYAWPESQISGSPSDTSKQNTTSSAYDFNTGLVNNSTDANGRISNAEYDPNSLRLVRKTSPTLAYNHYIYDDVAMTVKGFAYEAGLSGPNFASRVDKFLDGKGRVIKEVAFGKADAQDVVDMKYDQLGRLSQQTRPYRAGATPQWSTMTYDFLDRPAQTTAPDGSVVTMSYNQPDPPGSSGQPGETTKMTDPWGRERWSRTDALGRMVEVAEPNPGGAGTLSSGALFTTYDYDALDRLVQVNQGIQTRSFRYDSLDRLTHQKMAERAAALNDSGQWVGAGAWSDVFTYDRRSNLTQHFDARGVKTIFKYIDAGGVDDPLNRLLAVQYDKGGSPSHLSVNIPVAPNVSYAYMTTGDKKRVQNVFVDQGMGNETMSYDSEGRLSRVDQTFTGREGYPLRTDHLWDSLGRQLENTYPQQYMAGEIRKKVEPAYDVASRIESLKFGGATYVSEPVYNASSQATSLKIGSQMFENYEYDPKTGMLTNQKVIRGTTETLLDLKYNYTLNNDANNNGPKTGQLTGVTDMKNQARNTAYEYDKLERLVKVKGGVNAFSNPTWFQNYSYDRFGNKNASSQTPTDTVWFDDSLPAGAATGAAGGDSWNWVSSSPAPLSGSVSHISNIAVDTWSPPPFSGNVSHQSGIVEGGHQQYFWGASPRFLVRNGGLLYAHVYLDPENPPRQIMLQWGEDLNGWDHRAYWGENLIGFGTDGTNSRRYIGPLPAAGGWVRLQVPASAVGLEGRLVHAMAFTLYGGRANWDLAGAEGVDIWYEEVCDELMGCYFVPHYESVNDVFMDDSIPAGATPGADGGYGWNWTGAKPRDLVHQHYFDGATNTLNVNAGDVLYTWAWLDPANKPKQAMLQWNDGSWEHRAYWGENKIGWGVDGTASRKYMGGLPAAGGWVKLEVPASAVGLEGRAVKGMAFTLYGGRAAWDKAGKIGTPPPNLVMGLDGFENLTYNAANNQIISQNFEYDAAGNQTKAVIDGAGTVQQYRYDCANRLVQVLDGSGNVLATHAYGAGNQRLMSVEGGVTRYFAWSRGKIIAEYEAWGTNALIWKTSYVYLGGSLLATTSGANGNETRFHHSGRFGTRLVTASDGTVVTEQFTMPFGNMQPFTSIYGGENPYQNPTLSNPSKKRFTSYDRSAVTSLDYAVNRYYSPQQGRFTQVDPIDMDAASLINPQTLNMYAYCGGDPINREDPEGLFWGAIGRFFKAIGRAIASFFFSGGIGSSGPGFRTPPTFPGSLPGITAAARSGLGGFRTPPFVNGFLQTQDNSWSWERFKNWLNGDGWVTDAEAGRARRLKIEAKLKEAHDYLKSHGLTEEYLGTLTFQEQIDLYEAAKRGDSSFTLDDGRIIQIVAPGQPGNPTPTPTPIPPKVLDKLGGLADRANDKVADVIRSRGGTGSNVNEAGHWAQKTMAETAEAAVKGDMLAEKAIKLSKMAPKKGQRRRK